MPKTRKRKAWVIQWVWFGEHRKVEPNILHILSARWPSRKVLDYMRGLYMNSDLFLVSERFRFTLPRRNWDNMVIHEGPRLSFGHNPTLTAWYVSDLATELDKQNFCEIVRWTQTPGKRLNPESGEIENLGEPIQKEFRISYAS